MQLKPGLRFLAIVVLFFVFSSETSAQKRSTQNIIDRESITQGQYTLIYINKDENFKSEIGQKLKETFFEVYPEMAREYNRKAAKKVVFVIDPAYDGVAATSNARVVFNPRWFDRSPNDIDVVTHEVMHIVQDYGNTPGPWWVTEGIADYVRYKYGVNNAAAGWSLPEVTDKQNYDNSYRISARFFVWIEQNKNKHFIKKMDRVMRKHTYEDEIWVKLTGKNPTELWQEYTLNPQI
ncbi:basic secretory protein-like protein [Maribellus sediminis]|uniref:basic secretory protein-like protein n=1 Tax=Maribellus sediminis TaxID=2696285 RepID=UPI0014320DBE|nr:basic secretory protein-like protein [Maribellus sediminis]